MYEVKLFRVGALIIQGKAIKFIKELDIENFPEIDGRLQSWNIRNKTMDKVLPDWVLLQLTLLLSWLETLFPNFVSTYGFQNIYITDGFRHFSLFLPHKTCQIKLGNCSGRNKSKICIGDIEAANAVNGKLPFTMASFPL